MRHRRRVILSSCRGIFQVKKPFTFINTHTTIIKTSWITCSFNLQIYLLKLILLRINTYGCVSGCVAYKSLFMSTYSNDVAPCPPATICFFCGGSGGRDHAQRQRRARCQQRKRKQELHQHRSNANVAHLLLIQLLSNYNQYSSNSKTN